MDHHLACTLALSALLGSGCVDAPAFPGADAPTTAVPDADAPTTAVPDAAGSACLGTASFDVKQVDRQSACYYDTTIHTGGSGTLTFPCAGGVARLAFGDTVFTGQFNSQTDVLVLTRDHAFFYSDGCNWNSTQTITGRLSKGAFKFTYAEQPAPGETGCAHPCDANGMIIADVKPLAP